MKLQEADAKTLLVAQGLPVPGWTVAHTAAEARAAAETILAGGVEWWEPLLALGLLGLFAAVTVWIGERLYRRALLQTGGRVSLRQAWSAAE